LWFWFPFCSHTCPPDAFFIIVIILHQLIFSYFFPEYPVARKTPGNSRAPPPLFNLKQLKTAKNL
jgi:hypothetical protein